MGMTYTICACKDGYKCKGLNEKDKFDTKHWGEVKENLVRYLNEPICVPGASAQATPSQNVHNAINQFIQEIAACRTNRNQKGVSHWFERRKSTAQVLAILSNLPIDLLTQNGTPITSKTVIDTSLADVDEVSLAVIELSVILAQSYERAAVELVESVQTNSEVHIVHHLGIITDIVAEMHSLVIQAIAHISTENLLPSNHPHKLASQLRTAEFQAQGLGHN